MHGHPDPQILPVHIAEHDAAAQDGHHDHHKQEAGAAAGVVLGLDAGVFHRQRQARLIAEDGLMLRPVIAEHPAHVLLPGAEDQVSQENGDLHRPLDEVVHGGMPGVEQPGDEGGQQHEQQQRQPQGQDHRHPHQHRLQLLRRNVLLQPLIQLGGLDVFVLGVIVGGEHQGLDAPDHGVQKRDGPPDDGPAQNGVLVLDQGQLLHLGHQALRRADHDGLLFRPAHENALDQGLTADGGAELLVVFFHGEWVPFQYHNTPAAKMQQAFDFYSSWPEMGSRMVTMAPPPSALPMSNTPPWRWTISSHTARPMPLPRALEEPL